MFGAFDGLFCLIYISATMAIHDPLRPFDKRTYRRYLSSGRLEQEAWNEHISARPDAAVKVMERNEGGDDDGFEERQAAKYAKKEEAPEPAPIAQPAPATEPAPAAVASRPDPLDPLHGHLSNPMMPPPQPMTGPLAEAVGAMAAEASRQAAESKKKDD